MLRGCTQTKYIPEALRHLVLLDKLAEDLVLIAWVLIEAGHIYDLEPWCFSRFWICLRVEFKVQACCQWQTLQRHLCFAHKADEVGLRNMILVFRVLQSIRA